MKMKYTKLNKKDKYILNEKHDRVYMKSCKLNDQCVKQHKFHQST